MPLKVEIEFRLNGVGQRVSVAPDMTVLEMLRGALGLTGTKYGCGEGECGTCTIRVDGATVNSCLMPAVDCEGRELQTIEGFAVTPAGERLARSFVNHGAVQCGFCTPGMMMQAGRLLDSLEMPSRETIQRGIEGNLCRCTGYKKIIDAIADAAGKDAQ
jgi:aerobic carbon-monoxide dehydrogenase small subunit